MENEKKRHGCLTAWLLLMILANSLTALMYVFGTAIVQGMPGWTRFAFALLGVVNLACGIALYQWKKWGYWGFIGTSIIGFFINLMIGVGVLSSVAGLVGIGILYGVLQIGEEEKGWPQLE